MCQRLDEFAGVYSERDDNRPALLYDGRFFVK